MLQVLLKILGFGLIRYSPGFTPLPPVPPCRALDHATHSIVGMRRVPRAPSRAERVRSGEDAFLRSAWHWLDIAVVSAGSRLPPPPY